MVVRARSVSETNAHDDHPSPAFRARWGEGGPVVLNLLDVQQTFKGGPGPRINVFQARNSGAFYLDADTDYLLFLTYIPPDAGRPSTPRGAMYVRYACGQSRTWNTVAASDLSNLQALAAAR